MHLRRILRFSLVLILIPIILYPHIAFSGACTGILLWFDTLVPTLLPLMILSDLLQSFGIVASLINRIQDLIQYIQKNWFQMKHIPEWNLGFLYPLFFGLLSGLPLGAKLIGEAVRNKSLSQKAGQFLLTVCNNCSMMFLMGYLAEQSLQLPQYKGSIFLLILFSSLLSAVLCFIFFRIFTTPSAISPTVSSQQVIDSVSKPHNTLIQNLNASIMDSFRIITQIGGYIILFSVFCEYLNGLPEVLLLPLSGLLEVTSGIRLISSSSFPEPIKITLSVATASFSGLSGIAQTGSMLYGTGLSLSNYIVSRILGCCISILILLIFL